MLWYNAGKKESDKDEQEKAELGATAKSVDSLLDQYLSRVLKETNAKGKFLESRIVCLSSEQAKKSKAPTLIALVSLGDIITKQGTLGDTLQDCARVADAYRQASAEGVATLMRYHAQRLFVDSSAFTQAVAEGATLKTYASDALKTGKKEPHAVALFPFRIETTVPTEVQKQWDDGIITAQAQNIARHFTDAPSNLCTPTNFVAQAVDLLKGHKTIRVTVRERAEIEAMGMGLVISVTQGSNEPPRLLEIEYNGSKPDAPVLAFVGKGITFDSGGLALKPAASMYGMKMDMMGAATVVGAITAIASLQLPVRVVGVMALCDNMPSSKATKPGDVFVSYSGKTVEVENPDAEGRLILADTLSYTQRTFKPAALINLATLTGAICVALGNLFAGVFSSSDDLWDLIRRAGAAAGEGVWRMPLADEYFEDMKSEVADMKNMSNSKHGGSCNAAVFLKQFVDSKQTPWAHIDIASVMTGGEKYFSKNSATGKPARLLVELARLYATTQK